MRQVDKRRDELLPTHLELFDELVVVEQLSDARRVASANDVIERRFLECRLCGVVVSRHDVVVYCLDVVVVVVVVALKDDVVVNRALNVTSLTIVPFCFDSLVYRCLFCFYVTKYIFCGDDVVRLTFAPGSVFVA